MVKQQNISQKLVSTTYVKQLKVTTDLNKKTNYVLLNAKLYKLLALLFFIMIGFSNVAYSQWKRLGIADYDDDQISGEFAFNPTIATDNSGTIYIAFEDPEYDYRVTVKKFFHNRWITVGNPGFSTGGADYTSIVISKKDTVYVAYSDFDNDNKATVMKYNGTAWVAVGDVNFSDGGTNYTSIALDSTDVPYVVYQDYTKEMKATLMKFNGSVWQTVGKAGFSADVAYFTSVAFDIYNIP